MSNQATYRVEEVGIFRLQREPRSELPAGAGGYIICGIKTVSATRIGDTITLDADPAPAPIADIEPVAAAEAPSYDHVLYPGETLEDVARQYGCTQQEIMQLNGIADPEAVKPGTKLLVPIPQ